MGVKDFLFGSEDKPGVFGTGQQGFAQPQAGQFKRDANGNPVMGEPRRRPNESYEDFEDRKWRYFSDASAGDPVIETDPYKAWQDPQAEARRAQLESQLGKYEGRQLTGDARISQEQIAANRFGGAAQAQTAGFQQGQGARVGAYERGQTAQLAPAERIQAERVGNINIGQAQGYGGATIDPAAQARAAQIAREDTEFRRSQVGLQSQLEEQAAGRGPSLAEGQLRAATDRNIKQQQAAAAASGGPSALAARGLRIGAAQQGQEAAQAAAQMRIQEQLAARQQLAGVSQTGRAQDIEVAQTQAQLIQQANLANQAAINARAGQQAGLTQQAGIFSAEQMNQRQLQQAQLQAQLALANQQAGMTAAQANQAAANQMAMQQGQFGQQMNLANMQAFNERQALQAQLYQQGGLATQAQMNQAAQQYAGFQQQAGLANQQYANQALFANQQAAMQQQALNDAMARYYTEAGLSLDARQQQAMMAFQGLQSQQALGYAGLEQRAYEGAREGVGGMMGGIGSAIGALAMFSDEEVKQSATRGDDKIGQFLQQYMSGTQDLAQQYATSPSEKSGGGGLFGGMGGAMSSAGMASAMKGGGAAAAMSDQKAKDLSAENDRLKAQMVGMSMQQGSGGKGLFGGLGGGIAAGAQAKAMQEQSKKNTNTEYGKALSGARGFEGSSSSQQPARPDPSSQMTPVMNNPNAAIAVPGGPQGAAMMAPNYVPTTTPAWQPGYQAPMQTWGVPQGQSSSPVEAKAGIGAGDMQISNFLKSIYQSPTDDTATAGSSPMMMPSAFQAGANPMSGPSMGGVGRSPMAYSDKFTKQNIDNMVDRKIENLLDNLHAYEYSYKQPNMPGRGYGRFVSPMAQELERTDLGRSAVIETPNGKMVDYGKLGGVMLAAQAYLNSRLEELEMAQNKKGRK